MRRLPTRLGAVARRRPARGDRGVRRDAPCALRRRPRPPGARRRLPPSPLIASGEITIADCTAAALAASPGKGRDKWLDEPCWRDGTTGFPFVGAGMRELAQTAWMHIRARMVTPSTPTERSAAGRLPEWGTDAYPEPMPGLAAEAGEAAEAKERFRAASR